ncbi:hypothetical protein [Corynebacterium lubricantis]|uniref:hypothetical protein n=1 Tax=Corynebacterium lubricantis TaxID=541095 RepID=UPI0012E9DCE0|nr:hypothetical protein [Corynebacterium lubricantis]
MAVSAGLVLASCTSSETGDGGTGGQETTAKEPNAIPTKPPHFEGSDERFASIANEGCSSMFTEKAEEFVLYYTAEDGGNAEYVDVSFQEGNPTQSGHKTCDIIIKDADITDIPGGDINNATITVSALSAEQNEYNRDVNSDLYNNRSENVTEFENVNDVAGVSVLADDGLAYASSNGLVEDSTMIFNTNIDPNTRGYLFNDNTAMNLTFSINPGGISEEVEPYGLRGAWVSVQSDDPQETTSGNSRNAIGHMAYTLSMLMYGKIGKGSGEDYVITG